MSVHPFPGRSDRQPMQQGVVDFTDGLVSIPLGRICCELFCSGPRSALSPLQLRAVVSPDARPFGCIVKDGLNNGQDHGERGRPIIPVPSFAALCAQFWQAEVDSGKSE